MADDHYRAVCRALFDESVELRKSWSNIKRAKKALMKLLEDNPPDRIIPEATIYWSPMWMQLMAEVKHGVKLKKEHKHHYNPLPMKTELSPIKNMLDDLRHRRYTLRKVPVTDKKPKSPLDQLDFAHLRSLLKPASTRKLKAQPPPTPCLHEMLMKEIQTARTLRSVSPGEDSSARELSVRKRQLCETSTDSQCVQSSTSVKRPRTDSQLQADPSDSEQSWETGERRVFFGPDSSTDVSKEHFCSAVSTYVNVKELVWHSVNQCKPHYPLQIMRPFGSFYELVENEDFHYSSTLLVQELVCVCQTLAKRKMITCKTVKDKFCFCCQRELFFTWALPCHLCKKVRFAFLFWWCSSSKCKTGLQN
ncbi:protein spire homolog 1-like [Callorhinchus milii]|uniref:protein spire homolog 1-like n=1 Tax=Callorhinchus milii TaxID=7868 RepID=UPI001C3FD6A1|nr:protein spire homolog 1-like [Callorhinchus milii]